MKRGISPATSAAIDNMASVWAAVDALTPKVLAVRPPGSFTEAEYAARFGVGGRTASTRVHALLDAKKVIRVKVALPRSDGAIFPTWCYTPCK